MMLSDLVDDDLLSGSIPLSNSTKTITNTNHNLGKFLFASGQTEILMTIIYIYIYIYIWNLTHVRCINAKERERMGETITLTTPYCKITIICLHTLVRCASVKHFDAEIIVIIRTISFMSPVEIIY